MLLESISLVGGLIAGTKLNISNELLLGGSLLASVIVPSVGTAGLLLTLGLGVSTIVKNIVKEKYINRINEIKETSKDLVNSDVEDSLYTSIEDQQYINNLKIEGFEDSLILNKEELHKEGLEGAKKGFWCFTSTLAFNTIPFQLLSLIKGLSTILMPISIITLVIKGWVYINTNPTKAIKALSLTIFVSIIAFFCLTNISSGGVFTYFLSIISIPSLLIKNKQNTPTFNNNKETINNIDSFLYGGVTNNTSIIGTALVLAQTILWGSGKDVLGTVINNDISVLLDPYRFLILITIIAYLTVLGNTSFINNVVKQKTSNTTNINTFIKLISLIYCLFTFNPLIIIFLITSGLFINTLDNNNFIRNISIPLLLIIGVLTNF
jgi:hypothetical protein